MTKKSGILTGLVLSLAITGSALASTVKPPVAKSGTAVQAKKKHAKKHHKSHNKMSKKSMMKKDATSTTPPSK